MQLPVMPPVEPMLSALQEEIPKGEVWVYEPKWDGFRAIIFRDQGELHIGSRKGQPLERYFPELVELFKARLPDRCVLDGEIIIAGPKGLDFDALQQRIHPAASRVQKLSKETPADFVAFDVLCVGDEDLRSTPFNARRQRLTTLFQSSKQLFVTPQTSNPTEAAEWFERYEGAGLDGIIAKRLDGPYMPGDRVMVKIKHRRTADCVVGGYRMTKDGKTLGSLLLGLYDQEGALHFVGHTSAFSAKEKPKVLELLKPLEIESSFSGRSPGGQSRWSSGKELPWTALRPDLVCEVSFDYLQGPRFRHAAGFMRWRTDKEARDCTFEQLLPPHPFELDDIVRSATTQ